ncbi:hypothetical protein [Pseudomonas mucidolens]
MPEEIIKRDLGKLLLKLEGLQEASNQEEKGNRFIFCLCPVLNKVYTF